MSGTGTRFAITFVLGAVTILAALPRPALAQVPPKDPSQLAAELQNGLTRLLFEVQDTLAEVERLNILEKYCKPPDAPSKIVNQWDLDHYTAKVAWLQARLETIRKTFNESVKAMTGASRINYVSSFPSIKGDRPDVTDERSNQAYWAAASGVIGEVSQMIALKQRQLNGAPEEPCRKALQPSQQETPPPAPPTGPGVGRARPTPADIPWPKDLPRFFCTLEEKVAFFEAFRKTVFSPALGNEREAGAYSADVEYRAQDLERQKRGSEASQLRRTEGRWADQNHEAHLKVLDRAGQLGRQINQIPIVDCNPGTQDPVRSTRSVGASERRFSITVNTGYAAAGNSSSGTGTALPAGQPFTTPGGRTSEAVYSPVAGAGPLLLNQVAVNSGKASRITSLDNILTSASADEEGGFVAGVRVKMLINEHLGLYASVEFVDRAQSIEGAAAAIEQAASSTRSYYDELLGAAQDRQISSVASLRTSQYREIGIRGGVEIPLRHSRGLRADLWVGGGTVSGGGGEVAVVDTNYAFRVGAVPFSEGNVTRISASTSRALSVEGGLRLHLRVTQRGALVFDVGVEGRRNTETISVSTENRRTTIANGGVITFIATPTISISNNANFPSSMSRDIPGITTWKGSGFTLRPVVRIGIVREF